MIPLTAALKTTVWELETGLNITPGNITLSPGDMVQIKAIILKEIALVAWACLIIGFAIGATATYYYCKRNYGIQ